MAVLRIYRPPKPNSAFIPEIHDLLTTLCTSTSSNLTILGDANIHVDTPSRPPASDLLQLLDCLHLTQHVKVPTHDKGHTLDFVICSSPISYLKVLEVGVSDHKLIQMELPFPHPHAKPKWQISFRNIKNINQDTITQDLQLLSSYSATFTSVSEAVDYYNSSLANLLDIHAHVKRKTVTFSHSAPWYTSELRLMKSAGRTLEHRLKNLRTDRAQTGLQGTSEGLLKSPWDCTRPVLLPIS